jgi:hypothetical protein
LFRIHSVTVPSSIWFCIGGPLHLRISTRRCLRYTAARVLAISVLASILTPSVTYPLMRNLSIILFWRCLSYEKVCWTQDWKWDLKRSVSKLLMC